MKDGSLYAVGDTCYLKYYIIEDGERVNKTIQWCKRSDVYDWWKKRRKWGYSSAVRDLQRTMMDKIKADAKAADAVALVLTQKSTPTDPGAIVQCHRKPAKGRDQRGQTPDHSRGRNWECDWDRALNRQTIMAENAQKEPRRRHSIRRATQLPGALSGVQFDVQFQERRPNRSNTGASTRIYSAACLAMQRTSAITKRQYPERP